MRYLGLPLKKGKDDKNRLGPPSAAIRVQVSCSNPHLSAIRVQVAYWSRKEPRRFDETFFVEGI